MDEIDDMIVEYITKAINEYLLEEMLLDYKIKINEKINKIFDEI